MKNQTAICVVLFVGFLAGVAIQTALHPLPEPILHGVFKPAGQPVLTWESWFRGEFQRQVQGTEQKAGWIDGRLGFRSVWVKTDNQINFSVFREIPKNFNPQEIILGRDNWLYEQEYIDSLFGLYVAAPEELERFAADLKRLQQELRQRGITMLVVISPSKAVHYPEYLPDWVWPQRDRLRRQGIGLQSDYEILAPLLDREGIDWIDVPTRFRRERDRQRTAGQDHRLFPRGGTHWSHYGADLVAGEVLERLEQLTGRDLMDLAFGQVDVDRRTTGTDNDLGDVMNTWTPWVTKGPTPHVHILGTPGSWHPDVLFAGSSYIDTLTALMDEYEVYRRRDTLFLFWRRSTWPDPKHESHPIDRERFDWPEELLTRDVVVIELNEAHLYEFAHGFVEGALRFFDGQSSP